MAKPDLSSISDNYFTVSQKGYLDTLNGSITDVDTVLTVNNISGFDDGASTFLWLEPGTDAEELVYGIVTLATNQLTSLVRAVLGTAGAHSNGATIAFYVSSAEQMLTRKGLLVEHHEDATHSDITADSLLSTGDIATSLGSIKGDTVAEYTSGHGVTIDGLNIKDGAITTTGSIPSTVLAGIPITPDNTVGATSTPPAGANYLLKTGQVVLTINSSSYSTITFASPFPNGCLIAFLTYSDTPDSDLASPVVENLFIDHFRAYFKGITSGNVRVNYLAIGW